MLKVDVKALLVQSMYELMSRKTISKITVQEIIDTCGVSRSTFYRHFLDKYELMNYCYKSTVNRFISNIKSDNWKDILVDIISFMKERQTFFVNAIKHGGSEPFLGFLYDYSYQFYEEQYLLRTNSSKLTREEHDCIAFTCSGEVWLVELWARRNMEESPEEMAERIYKFMPQQF